MALSAGALSLVVKTAKETGTVTEDEKGGQGHQTALKLPRDSQGGCLEGLGGPWKLGEPRERAASWTEGPQEVGGARGHGLTLSEALLYR